jgi:hypothetical protein
MIFRFLFFRSTILPINLQCVASSIHPPLADSRAGSPSFLFSHGESHPSNHPISRCHNSSSSPLYVWSIFARTTYNRSLPTKHGPWCDADDAVVVKCPVRPALWIGIIFGSGGGGGGGPFYWKDAQRRRLFFSWPSESSSTCGCGDDDDDDDFQS